MFVCVLVFDICYLALAKLKWFRFWLSNTGQNKNKINSDVVAVSVILFVAL